MEFARSKAAARKEGLTGVEFTDVAGLGPILGEVLEVVEVRGGRMQGGPDRGSSWMWQAWGPYWWRCWRWWR